MWNIRILENFYDVKWTSKPAFKIRRINKGQMHRASVSFAHQSTTDDTFAQRRVASSTAKKVPSTHAPSVQVPTNFARRHASVPRLHADLKVRSVQSQSKQKQHETGLFRDREGSVGKIMHNVWEAEDGDGNYLAV